MKPIIQYKGGKRDEIEYFEHHIPKQYDRYIEPFIGGGALFFHLEPKRAVINDVNKHLITFYRDVIVHGKRIMKELEKIKSIVDSGDVESGRTLYNNLRDEYNGLKPSKYHKSTLYYFLNKVGHSGLMRWNRKGLFNTSYGGKPKLPLSLTEKHIKLLRSTEIYDTSYKDILEVATENDFVFLDPPYDCWYTCYGNADSQFKEQEHIELANLVKQSKAKILMVLNGTDFTRELYKDYIVEEYSKRYETYKIDKPKDKNQKAMHLIIKNY